jgi:ATP-dependent protease ClpP protease subunit
MNRHFSFADGRPSLRLPMSPMKAATALRALENWREPDTEGRDRHWYKINKDAAGPARVNIFDEIGWYGITAEELVTELAGISGDIEVHINSPGGSAFDGMAIYNALASRPGNVTTIVDGLAASAASTIAMAGRPRVMSPGAMLMIHDAMAMCMGNEADMLDTARMLSKISDNIASVYAQHSGKTAAEWRDAMRGEGQQGWESWYTAQEAVDAGLADELAARPGPGAEPGNGWDETIFARWSAPAVRDSDGGADESAWDAGKAWANGAASDDPAAFYAGICAGKKAGDPATQGAHALPHHYHPGDPPNRAGVSAALGRIGSTDDLTNKAAAQSHLDAHKAAMGSGSSDHGHAAFITLDPEIWDSVREALKGAMK